MKTWRDKIYTIVRSPRWGAVIWLTIILLPCFWLFSNGASLTSESPTPSQSYSVSSPSGAATIVKQYNGEEQRTYDLQLKTSRGGKISSTQIIPPQDVFWDKDPDGIIFGWKNDRHLTVAWPNGFKSIHGQEHVGDIDINYQSYEPDIDLNTTGNLHNLRLHNTSVSFNESDLPYGKARYATTNEPVPNIKCIIEINGADGEAFEGVTVQIIGDGIGRPSDKYPNLGMVGVKYIFTKAVGQYASLTPTQAKLGSVYPHFPYASIPPVKTVIPVQTDRSLYYHSYSPSEALYLFSSLQKGKLAMKVGLNFGQEIISYEADVNLSKDIIDRFNACSAKTNFYRSPGDINFSPFQVPQAEYPHIVDSKDSLSASIAGTTWSGTSSGNTEVIPSFRIGESFDTFVADMKAHGSAGAQIDQQTKTANDEVTSVWFPTSGVRLFFSNGSQRNLETVRFDAPYSGKVRGIAIGDSLSTLTTLLGTPVAPPWKYGLDDAYLFSGEGNRFDRFDVGNGVVKTILMLDK